ncbi:hypothetical protein TCAL_01400, partial [Tigriopus californicus]
VLSQVKESMPDLTTQSVKDLEQRLLILRKEEADIEAEIHRRKLLNLDPDNAGVLSNLEITRYSRQLLLPEWGVQGQLALKRGRVLLVGGGGLGCPSALFLGGCGVGTLGVVDFDEVDVSNLHRQVLHSEKKLGWSKVESIKTALRELNSLVHVETYPIALGSHNALDIISKYDVVLDCSDNVATRYLLNDACVLTNKPLVSGSALRFEGQLTVYNYNQGPTYRCLFPEPPPPETVTNCSDGGVLGVIPGVIGTLQALEAMKILAGFGTPLSGKMLLFDGFSGAFRTVKLRPRQEKSAQIVKLIDYEQFCGALATDKEKPLAVLPDSERINVDQLQEFLKSSARGFTLLDVRSEPEMDICHLVGSVNVPIGKIDKEVNVHKIQSDLKEKGANKLIVLCRRGNDSQKAVLALKKTLKNVQIQDVKASNHSPANDNEQEKQQLNKEKKHDSGAADLEKVTDYAEEKEIISTSTDLEDAITIIRNRKVAESAEQLARERELAKVAINKEDVDLILNELEINKTKAERTLREHQGNVVEALAALTN